MFRLLKLSFAMLLLSIALPVLASPLAPPPPKKAGKQRHSRTIPARHNAGRPMHA
ncbi:hypothetical protein [Candidatus Korobacter versatilis]|uniref:hypothetical protein n=1 Tax=Candidatus Korobacter versatilis TaxID=658062 RepID=UPI0002DCD2AE|nr:hypothetical protein [Candidatus Koribacter versatilis]